MSMLSNIGKTANRALYKAVKFSEVNAQVAQKAPVASLSQDSFKGLAVGNYLQYAKSVYGMTGSHTRAFDALDLAVERASSVASLEHVVDTAISLRKQHFPKALESAYVPGEGYNAFARQRGTIDLAQQKMIALTNDVDSLLALANSMYKKTPRISGPMLSLRLKTQQLGGKESLPKVAAAFDAIEKDFFKNHATPVDHPMVKANYWQSESSRLSW